MKICHNFLRMSWELGPRDELVQAVETGRVRPCRTLDPGCGSGSNAVFLAQRGLHVTGVDFAAQAIAKARRRAEVAQVSIDFIVDDPTNLRHVSGRFDFFVDYGTFDDLDARARDSYVANVLSLAVPGSAFLLWRFEWRMRWWERLVPFFSQELEPGVAERRFGPHFSVERLEGSLDWSQLAAGLGCVLAASQNDTLVQSVHDRRSSTEFAKFGRTQSMPSRSRAVWSIAPRHRTRSVSKTMQPMSISMHQTVHQPSEAR